jgi:hypothetical protein
VHDFADNMQITLTKMRLAALDLSSLSERNPRSVSSGNVGEFTTECAWHAAC